MASTAASRRMTVADVYDAAADIGKEFEVVIDTHGPDHIAALMGKCKHKTKNEVTSECTLNIGLLLKHSVSVCTHC